VIEECSGLCYNGDEKKTKGRQSISELIENGHNPERLPNLYRWKDEEQ